MMLQSFVAVVALALTWVATCCAAPSPPPPTSFVPSGRDKDAWPELINMNVNDAIAVLQATGLVKNMYEQPPSNGPAPTNLGSSSDVWIYTDGSLVYETPRRGVWHPNRLIPGWPEVNGLDYKQAIAKIKADYFGVTVVYGPKSSIVRTAQFVMDRVYLEVNTSSKVVGVPFIG